MTDRYNAFIVILDRDIREDDAEATINAIKQIKGVLGVQPHIADANEGIAEARVRRELIAQLWKVFYPDSMVP